MSLAHKTELIHIAILVVADRNIPLFQNDQIQRKLIMPIDGTDETVGFRETHKADAPQPNTYTIVQNTRT